MRLADIDRPLNKRGKRDAPSMASHCKEKNYIPELLISSTAKRASQTALLFVKGLGVSIDSLSFESTLYHAPEDTYVDVCFGIEDSIDSVMMFGHNPGITYLANSVSDEYIDNVPTCGVLVIDTPVASWNDLSLNNCKLVDFLYPKMF